MVIEIQFIKNCEEKSIPIIEITRSKNGKTGTATFIFIKPKVFDHMHLIDKPIKSIILINKHEQIISKDITFFYLEGKPFVIKAIFLFKNSKEWFCFFTFMRDYSKKTGLSFSEKDNRIFPFF